ncbi:MAG: hypothetical protein KH301_07130 [Brachyspira sp.]|nr:hypothetical protein [Brachyspira sp.]
MSYKNDSYLVIANKFGSASGEAKAQLFETYDKLRDLTVSGSGSGTGFEMTGSFLYRMASLLAPSSFANVFGASESMNIPGTSYHSPFNGGSSYGIDSLYNYSGFPGGAAPVAWGLGGSPTGGAAAIAGWGTSSNGVATGFASSLGGIADVASAAAYGVGGANGYGWFGKNIVLPVAGVISGWGGIMQAAAPYLGEYGLPAIVMANLMQGTSSAALAAYQNVTGNITANADTILSNKVRNIETVCKMLDTQGDVVKKMLKESIDGDSKAIQNL